MESKRNRNQKKRIARKNREKAASLKRSDKKDKLSPGAEMMFMMHFPEGKYGCENCEDFKTSVCPGEGFKTKSECVKCFAKKEFIFGTDE